MKQGNKFAVCLIILISFVLMACGTKQKVIYDKPYCPSPSRPIFVEIREDLPFDNLQNAQLFLNRHNQVVKYLKDLENVIKCYESEDVRITKK